MKCSSLDNITTSEQRDCSFANSGSLTTETALVNILGKKWNSKNKAAQP